MRPRRSLWKIESAGALLAILALINFLNYVDRFVIAALVPFLQKPAARGGLGLSSSQVGWLQTAFMLVHSVASIPLGALADRWLRKRLIAIGVGVWSVATAVAGFTNSFKQMFVARAAVGIGEATYAPAASALISQRFMPAVRARAMAIFQLGMVAGGAVGMAAGGMVASTWGWRAAFFVVGAPGLLLGILVLFIAETEERERRNPTMSLRLDVSTPGSVPAVVFIMLAGIFISFFTGAIGLWAPKYLLETRYGGDPAHIRDIVFIFGPIVVVGGISGAVVGSVVADRLEKRRHGVGRLIAVAIGVFASAPCAAVAFLSSAPLVQDVALFFGVFFNVWYVGPILAALHDVVPVRLRATVTGAYFCLIHLLGDGVSPVVVGRLDDMTGSLRAGLLLATGVLALGGVAALLAMPGSRRVNHLKQQVPS